MRLERVRRYTSIIPPNLVKQHISWYDPICGTVEEFEDVCFLFRESDFLVVLGHQHFLGRFEGVGPKLEDGVFRLFVLTQLRPNPCQQNGELERLRHIVVCTSIKPEDRIRVRVVTRQHEDRALDTLLAQPAAKFAPVRVGKADVKNHEVEDPRLDFLHGFLAVGSLEDVEVFSHHKLLAQCLAQIVVIVNKQDLLQVRHQYGPSFRSRSQFDQCASRDKICCNVLTRSCEPMSKCFNFTKMGLNREYPCGEPLMTLGPDNTERLARARADLRIGVPVLLSGAEGTAIIAAAETLTAERLAQLRSLGQPVLAVTDRRAQTLKARVYDGDLTRLVIPEDADVGWIRAVADPASDLASPMKGPFSSERDGAADTHRVALGLMKLARLLPAAVVLEAPPEDKVSAEDLTRLDLQATAEATRSLSPLHAVISGRVPLAASEAGRVHVFRPENGGEEHYAVEIGQPDRAEPVLVRLHSACFTGDVLGSLKCDCGPQLHGALHKIAEEGAGVLLYLDQEGRGIGLANKMRAYSLQDQGFDTVEANHRLGFEDDERDFRIGADILKKMGIDAVKLLTNNPAKIAMLEKCGVGVTERVPLATGRNPLNEAYLQTKARKSGHLL